MKHKIYSFSLIAGISLFLGILTFLSIKMQPLVGDLTRTGAYEEKDYGFNAPQKKFPQRLFSQETYDHYYDVVVLGDSFSEDKNSSGWQNFLVNETGVSVTTFPVNHANFQKIINHKTFKETPPKIFIYQTVERYVINRLSKSGLACSSNTNVDPVKIIPQPRYISLLAYERPTQKNLTDIDITYTKDFFLINLKRYFKSEGDVFNFKLKTSLFSSKKGDQLLVYKEDLNKIKWTSSDINTASCNLLSLQEEVQKNGKTLFLALVIPDKLSAYSEHLTDDKLAHLSVIDAIQKPSLNMVRVDHTLKTAIRNKIQDIYLPNDTHLGIDGYEIVAKTVMDYIQANEKSRDLKATNQ